MSNKALVVLADGLEEIEAIAIIDILRRADIDVITCGLDKERIRGAHGVEFIADKKLVDFKGAIDAIVLPGGMPGAEHLAGSRRVRGLIQKMHKEGRLIAAICASPALVLAPMGVLDGKRATTYPGMEGIFNKNITFVEEKVVVDENIITSRGPGTALLFSLAIVKKMRGEDVSENLRKKTLA